jgi:hypothetical protein
VKYPSSTTPAAVSSEVTTDSAVNDDRRPGPGSTASTTVGTEGSVDSAAHTVVDDEPEGQQHIVIQKGNSTSTATTATDEATRPLTA